MPPASTSSPYDPLHAVAESDATGEVAEILTDVRTVMGLPLVTSIWRSLAGVEGGLRATWKAARPLYLSGQPAAALGRLRAEAAMPMAKPLDSADLVSAGVIASELPVLRAVVEAYERSNGMNLLALSGLIGDPTGEPPCDPVPRAPTWPPLPPLMTQDELSADTWARLLRLNRFGATPDEPGLATLWRHLAHWPGFLELVEEGLAPLQRDGTIGHSVERVLGSASSEGGRLAHLRPPVVELPAAARAMIERYVTHPGLVARMVAIGRGLSSWLPGPEPSGDGGQG